MRVFNIGWTDIDSLSQNDLIEEVAASKMAQYKDEVGEGDETISWQEIYCKLYELECHGDCEMTVEQKAYTEAEAILRKAFPLQVEVTI